LSGFTFDMISTMRFGVWGDPIPRWGFAETENADHRGRRPVFNWDQELCINKSPGPGLCARSGCDDAGCYGGVCNSRALNIPQNRWNAMNALTYTLFALCIVKIRLEDLAQFG